MHRSVDYYIEKQAMLSSHAYKIEKVNRVKKFMGKYYRTSKLMDVTAAWAPHATSLSGGQLWYINIS